MNESKLIKISFIGDIMCEKPLLKASKDKNGKYDFNKVFKPIINHFRESDYVVGNLETVCAGEEYKYTNHIYNFNTPDEFIEAISNAGIDMVTTANNHCLDRGIEGLKRTHRLLDDYNIEHTGTFDSIEESEEILIKDISGVKVAFLSYTYGTNTKQNGIKLNVDNKHIVNLLQPQTLNFYSNKEVKNIKEIISKYVFKVVTLEQLIKLKKILNKPYNSPRIDDNIENIDIEYLDRIRKDIEKAKSQADFVVMCMHSGGQFNKEPGEFSKYMMDFMAENGVDIVVGTHPHIVQKYELINNKMIGIYSLGNFNISPSSVYLLNEYLPDYSIMLHLYLNSHNSSLEKATFTILKMVEDKKQYVSVYPIKDLFDNMHTKNEKERVVEDITKIHNLFLGGNSKKIEVLDEYEIKIN